MALLRDLKKKRCEEAIFRAAAALFNEQGYEQTTIRGIAERSEVAVGTLYNYYRSKSDLLLSMLASRFEVLEDSAKSYMETLEMKPEPIEALSGLYGIFAEAFNTYKKSLWRDILSAVYREGGSLNLWPLQQGFFVQAEKLIAQMQKSGTINPAVNPKLISETLYGLFFVQFLRYVNTEADVRTTAEALKSQFGLILSGIRA